MHERRASAAVVPEPGDPAGRERARSGGRPVVASLLGLVGQAVVLVDADDVVTYATPGAHTLLGLPDGGLVGRPLPVRRPLPRQLGGEASPAVRRIKVVHHTPDGDERRLLLLRRPTDDGAVVGLVELDRDDPAAEAALHIEAASRLTGLALWSRDLAADTLTWSRAMNQLCGLPPDGPAPDPAQWWSWIHPHDRALVEQTERELVDATREWTFVMRVVPPDGRQRHLRTWATIETDDAGRPVRIHGATMDVTASETAAAELLATGEQLRLAFDEAPTGMCLVEVDDDGVPELVRANRALGEILGVDDVAAGGLPALLAGLGGSALPDFSAAVEALVSGRRTRVSTETSFVRPDGGVGHVEAHASIAPPVPERRTQLIFHLTDVTARHGTQLELHRLAMSDPTTGLDNRAEFERRLGSALAEVAPGRRALAVLLLDLDRFKVVNDSLGHVAGDRLLVEVAGRLAETAPDGACVARLGGDEFAVVIDPAPSTGALLGLAHLLRERLARPYALAGGEVVVCTTSIGLTRVDDPSRSVEDVYREADLALYEAKDAGRNGCQLSDDRMTAKAHARIEAETRLRAALAADGVRIHLQPVVRLGGTAGRPVVEGAEALARLEHPTLGLLGPVEFVDVAEDTGLIVDVDLEVARQAVAHLAGHPDAPPWIAVNASPRTLLRPEYCQALQAALDEHGVDPARLHVEITERSLLDGVEASITGLETLRRMGVRVGIDDFGTGYSALAYLDRFPLDFLKIDKTFVARLGDAGDRSESVVSAIVALAHVYGMTVTAEGVETAEQALALERVGCDRGQGWLFGRPAPPA